MKFRMVCILGINLTRSLLFYASSPLELYQKDSVQVKQLGAAKAAGYGTVLVSDKQKEWQQLQTKIQEKLQPIADAVLHKSVVTSRIFEKFPIFKKYATSEDILLIKKNCIKAVAQNMILQLDWNNTHFSDTTSIRECAKEMEEAAVAKSSTWTLFRRTSADVMQELHEVSIDQFATVLPEFYSAIEGTWGYYSSEDHKEHSLKIWKELQAKYVPHEIFSEVQQKELFNAQYAQFIKTKKK